MASWHLHIRGQVQGVGFRPFVYRLARQFELSGWISNQLDGVHIEINASADTAAEFLQAILADPPPLAHITSYSTQPIPDRPFDRFQIVASVQDGSTDLLLTPDAAICTACRSELRDPNDRRYGYPFISCIHCGPRYSIIRRLPYDREVTSMAAFPLCIDCQAEYCDPDDRRYHAQTNSCAACPITLTLFDRSGKALSGAVGKLLERVVKAWQDGHLVAVKGIGGYLLTCDAANSEAIRTIRQRKHRPTKPLAVMYPDVSSLSADLPLRSKDREAISSSVAPILLLDVPSGTGLCQDLLAPGLEQLGVMLPYTPLHDLLLRSFGRPIVATSANISHTPIIFRDQPPWEALLPLADYVLSHDREIMLPQDDSVIRYTHFTAQPIILRRSRGLAPTYIDSTLPLGSRNILAMGAELKSTFTLQHQQNVFVSQYLGDLDSYEARQNYQEVIRHFLHLFSTRPELILVDEHPDYAATQYGRTLALEWNVPVFACQHHLAHFAALLGEHNLLAEQEPILGFIWDGTGLGSDGQIWGGECFRYVERSFQRTSHLAYFPFILGDKMPKEPRISALAWCWGRPDALSHLQSKFTPIEWKNYLRLLSKPPALQTSSAGRIFDAVAAILGICDRQTYEGEAAMQLENLALSYCKRNGLDGIPVYDLEPAMSDSIAIGATVPQILEDIKHSRSTAYIAARFHATLVEIIRAEAERQSCRSLAFSGGVFQNGLLVDMIRHYLGESYQLYFHERLSPNDENISFGQLMYASLLSDLSI